MLAPQYGTALLDKAKIELVKEGFATYNQHTDKLTMLNWLMGEPVSSDTGQVLSRAGQHQTTALDPAHQKHRLIYDFTVRVYKVEIDLIPY